MGRPLDFAISCKPVRRSNLSQTEKIGPFRLLTPLASGGMAEVWLAQRRGDPAAAPIVLKTILPRLANSPEFVSMFLNETRLATQLQHPNIVRVYESGFAENCHYIAMEYVVGRTLRQILWRAVHLNRLFPVWFAVEVAAAVCDALAYLHELCDEQGRPLRLLHRDVTPENVMVSFNGEVKLLDFGIARALSLPSMTQVGTFKGKYGYAAPELIDLDATAGGIDGRSDLYSLGVVFYETLTGTHPYHADNDAQLLQRILDKNRVVQPPSRIATWIPDSLDRIVLKCIAKKPDDRYRSAHTMRAALRDFMKDSGLCPTPRHIAAQVCGYSEDTSESSPPPSMRLQSPHEVALQLDSGCHAIRAPDRDADWIDLHRAVRSEPVLTNVPKDHESPGGDRRHDWDAAIRRAREDDDGLTSGELPVAVPVATQVVASQANSDGATREALTLLDKSFELLRCNDVEGAIAALKRAAGLEPNNRLVSANLRRLEQLTTTCDRARRRG
jgi:serine/threonine protein kinase